MPNALRIPLSKCDEVNRSSESVNETSPLSKKRCTCGASRSPLHPFSFSSSEESFQGLIWKDSSDEEKLNGCNGLLLAPHVHLFFDKGLVSFTDSDDLLTSSHLDRGILKALGIASELNVGSFNKE